MSHRVVIGAGYGDEGKGLMTDYFVSQSHSRSLVVRFNGGAQAGHTVVDPSGKRHVFKHFGSGTLLGADTYLSDRFILNPMLFYEEVGKLNGIAAPTVRVIANPDCLVTTPYDMLINQALEMSRGDQRHGSVGVGINETIERSMNGYVFKFRDMATVGGLQEWMRKIREEWVPKRMEQLGIQFGPLQRFVDSEHIERAYINDCKNFVYEVDMKTCDVIGNYDDVVFEGAQGLMLDEHHEYFPHVTRSKTGIAYVLGIAAGLGIPELDVTYVTRGYATRHGAGPFPNEDKDGKPHGFNDPTNVHNDFQGSLRFGILDIDVLKKHIHADLEMPSRFGVKVNPSVAITCMDQFTNERAWHIHNGLKIYRQHYDLPGIVRNHLGFHEHYESWGPHREKVRKYAH